MLIIFAVPYLLWRIPKTDYYAPFRGGPDSCRFASTRRIGCCLPQLLQLRFPPAGHTALNGIAWREVMILVCIAGIELDLKVSWSNRRETTITAGLALATPLLLGSFVASVMLMSEHWIGANANSWQFVVGIGIAYALTALPILIVFTDNLEILLQPIGRPILPYAATPKLTSLNAISLACRSPTRITSSSRHSRRGIFDVIAF